MKVNYCGIPETEFQDGICRACGKQCEIDSDLTVDARIFNYGRLHGLVAGSFEPARFARLFWEYGLSNKAPKYILRFVQEVEKVENEHQ